MTRQQGKKTPAKKARTKGAALTAPASKGKAGGKKPSSGEKRSNEAKQVSPRKTAPEGKSRIADAPERKIVGASGRRHPQDYFEAARAILKKEGFSQLDVRTLSSWLGVSTGSFYHHFKGREDFLNAFFDDYFAGQLAQAEDMLQSGGGGAGPGELNERLNAIMDHRLELCLRAWALFDQTVAHRIRVLDQERKNFLRALYSTDLTIDERALDLHVAALIGSQFLFDGNSEKLDAMGEYVNQLLRENLRRNARSRKG